MTSASIPTRSTPPQSDPRTTASALIAIVAVQLGVGAIRDALSLVTGALALILLATGVGTGRLILGGAVVGLIRPALGSP